MTDKNISYDRLVQMVIESKKDIANAPYGCICSEATFKLLKKHFEGISDKAISNLTMATVYGIKVRVEKLFPDETCWVLNRENYEEVEKNGLGSLLHKMIFSEKKVGLANITIAGS